MMRMTLLLACVLLLLSSAPTPGAEESEEREYLLGPGDVIEITVRNHPDLDRTLTILPDGKITYPEVGEIIASGKSPKALAAEIQAELDRTRNHLAVFVTVKEIHSRRVRIVGAVYKPGMYDLKPRWRALDLVAMAGGLNARPSRVVGRVVRGSSRVIPLHMAQAISDPSSDANPLLQPEDLILLEELEPVKNQVHVVGQVTKPGAYDLENGTNVLSLLSSAGNPTDRAALSRAYVLRGQKEIPLNLRALLVEGRPAPAVLHFKLQTGDVLFIPEIQAQYAVMGYVQRPGYYPVPEQGSVTVSRAILLAGGQNPDGDLSRVGVVRLEGGRYRVLPVSIAGLMQRGDLAADIPLRAEDIVFIPPRSRPFEWQSVVGPLTTLSILGVRFFR